MYNLTGIFLQTL